MLLSHSSAFWFEQWTVQFSNSAPRTYAALSAMAARTFRAMGRLADKLKPAADAIASLKGRRIA
jgi:hypothetical protein